MHKFYCNLTSGALSSNIWMRYTRRRYHMAFDIASDAPVYVLILLFDFLRRDVGDRTPICMHERKFRTMQHTGIQQNETQHSQPPPVFFSGYHWLPKFQNYFLVRRQIFRFLTGNVSTLGIISKWNIEQVTFYPPTSNSVFVRLTCCARFPSRLLGTEPSDSHSRQAIGVNPAVNRY